MERLTLGFELAEPYLKPKSYFSLLKRHQLLSAIPCSKVSAVPLPLTDLLKLAQVIRQFEPHPTTTHCMGSDRTDTLG